MPTRRPAVRTSREERAAHRQQFRIDQEELAKPKIVKVSPTRINLGKTTLPTPIERPPPIEKNPEKRIVPAPLKVRLQLKPGLASRRRVLFVSQKEQEAQNKPLEKPYLREIKKYQIKLEISDSSSSEAEAELIPWPVRTVEKGKAGRLTPSAEQERADAGSLEEAPGPATPP